MLKTQKDVLLTARMDDEFCTMMQAYYPELLDVLDGYINLSDALYDLADDPITKAKHNNRIISFTH